MSTSISASRLQPHCTLGLYRRIWLLGTPSPYCRTDEPLSISKPRLYPVSRGLWEGLPKGDRGRPRFSGLRPAD